MRNGRFQLSKSEVSTRFYPGEVTLGSDEIVGARRTGGGRYALCWWEVIHTVALTDIYPERYISPPGAATYRHWFVAPPEVVCSAPTEMYRPDRYITPDDM